MQHGASGRHGNAEWQSATGIAQRFSKLGAFQAGHSHRETDRPPTEESSDSAWLIDRQTEDLPAFSSAFLIERINQWEFVDARWAPRCPEIDQQGLAPKRGHGKRHSLRTVETGRPERVERGRTDVPGLMPPPSNPGARDGGDRGDRSDQQIAAFGTGAGSGRCEACGIHHAIVPATPAPRKCLPAACGLSNPGAVPRAHRRGHTQAGARRLVHPVPGSCWTSSRRRPSRR